jgi:hypothetical protein
MPHHFWLLYCIAADMTLLVPKKQTNFGVCDAFMMRHSSVMMYPHICVNIGRFREIQFQNLKAVTQN